MTRNTHALVCIGGATSLTLTFFHPAMWALFGVFLGVALLLITPIVILQKRAEPPGFFVALIWMAATALLATAYGFTQGYYNFKQVALVLAGLIFGYFVSLARAPAWAAWAPVVLFGTYFAGLLMLGRDPGDALSRNSENYVSVILITLFASAMIMTRAKEVRTAHVVAAACVLLISIWGSGRAGILASLLLAGGLFVRRVTQRRSGIANWAFATAALLIAAVSVYFAMEALSARGYFTQFRGRGIHDPSRISIIVSYFSGIETSELLFGKNYYHDSFMARWRFNLHNSYLEAWADLGLYYLLFILAVLGKLARNFREHAAMVIAVLAFAARAVTDTQMFCGQYDYVIFATLFILLREQDRRTVSAEPEPSRF